MLLDLRNYIKQRGSVSLLELSLHFSTPADALRGMLQHWLRKGVIQITGNVGCQKGCCGCDPAQVEIYCWQGQDTNKIICCHID